MFFCVYFNNRFDPGSIKLVMPRLACQSGNFQPIPKVVVIVVIVYKTIAFLGPKQFIVLMARKLQMKTAMSKLLRNSRLPKAKKNFQLK